ncbi:hypothetical protein BAUCODRAFT_508764 [Baudoinia panamericana UAMH 10762]|uniref:RNA helicase n=1 Tax=Baudoinia panamericana (strain UAMH 10762) TaxID=717646 RepID=M2N9W4_BAUPA|nr:uncharacterized protein BAUCODRAFT_508764 [Baudoinia panamericana UAMH 10762]EMC95919.1 hypothetical protein BAUCODRAFT_508764 [Baudoinia panamericana UAMH 10762]
MAKRAHEDPGLAAGVEDKEARREAKRLKKEKAANRAETAKNAIVGNGEKHDDAPENDTLSKEERRALKRAKKEAAKVASADDAAIATPTATENTDAANKAARKASKAAEKAAKKATKTDATDGIVSNGESSTVSRHAGAEYVEDAGLRSLPQSEIDTFIKDKRLAIEDTQGQQLRPIIDFKYLPLDDDQRKPFAGFKAPTPIQAACWPYLLAGRDLVGVAETGSGKTLAFGVPCLHHIAKLSKANRKSIKACIVTCVYGGVSKDEQRKLLNGTHVVVATPGRLNDFIQEGSIDLSSVQYVVLDEADRMLDTGFEQEVRKIISTTPATGRQTLMFTATWPPSVRELADTFMSKPVKVTIGDNASGELRANTRIVQEVEVMTEQQDKQPRLIQLLKQYQSGKNKQDRILVFCLYKKEATRIEEFIRRRGFNVAGIHGDLNQHKRTESLEAFKAGTVPILVATDVAARGLDIPAVKLVINVTFPLTVEDYVHRIGRTGRAGQDGKAITFFTDAEKGLAGALINVLKAAGQPVPEELMKYGTTVKKKGHDAYGAFYKDTTEMKKATKITFD